MSRGFFERAPVPSAPDAANEGGPSGFEKGAVLRDVSFSERDKGIMGKEYVSSAEGRKAIVARGFTPVPGERYTVKVDEDTNKSDPAKGKIFVSLVKLDSAKATRSLSAEEWKAAEDDLDSYERIARKGHAASVDLYAPGTEGAGTIAPGGRVEREAKRRKAEGKAAEDALGPEGAPLEALAGLRSAEVTKAIRKGKELHDRFTALEKEERELLSAKGGSAVQALRELRAEYDAVVAEYDELLDSSPEAFVTLHLAELKGYRRALDKGELAETPYVERMADDVEAHLRAGQPVMIYGHLGSGKTELSMYVAKRLSEQGALIISGAKDIALSELYGHQTLEIDKIDVNELRSFTETVEREFEDWKKKNVGEFGAKEEDLDRAHERILQTHLKMLEGGTVSRFFLGPIYRAMQEGRPVIIDEVNAIPHEVLISLNHVLTRKVGDKVLVQQNSGSEITVKEGFGFILTGNLDQGQDLYVREDMDPAFLSRLYKLEYDYLPQPIEGSLTHEGGSEKAELFHLMLASLMTKNGDLELPRESIPQLWNLAKAARVTQDVFSGKQVAEAYYFQGGGARPTQYKLLEGVLSNRALRKVLGQWQGEGFKNELDHYIWKEFISQSTVPADRAYLYQLFKDRFGFFQGRGWEQSPNYGKSGTLASFDVTSPENPSEDLQFFSARDTVGYAFGNPPERTAWPKGK